MDTILTTPTPSTPSNTSAEPAPPLQSESVAPQTPPSVDWLTHVPKGSEKMFDAFKGKSLNDVLTAHVEAQKMIGSSIRLPKPDAKPDEAKKIRDDIYAKLGRPESAEKYDIGELPVINDTFQWDAERVNAAKTKLFDAGLSNEQAKLVMGMFAQEVSHYFPDNVKTAAESREQLMTHYGSQGMFDRNIGFAHKAVKAYGDTDTVKWLEETGVGNSPAFVKLMAKLGRELAEHGAVEPSSEIDYISVSDAQAQLDKINNDKTDLYWSKRGTPGKEERMKEVSELYKIVAGEV